MERKRIYLVRHGQRVGLTEQTPLTPTGRNQADLSGKYLSTQFSENPLLYSSPLPRAQETAQIISQHLKVPIKTDIRLIERMKLGDRVGESYSSFLKEWNKTSLDRNYNPPGGDSSVIAGNRIKSLAEEVPEEMNAVFISHGGVIGDYLRNTFDDLILPFTFTTDGRIKYIDISYCSITEVARDRDSFKLIRINDIAHLV